jgi:hypothetical protein
VRSLPSKQQARRARQCHTHTTIRSLNRTRPAIYEVDHLIPLSLGESNSIRNLWPQSTKTSPWNSYVKDALERKLHKFVCAGQLDLQTAQREIASDWIEAYKKYVGKSPPAPRVRPGHPNRFFTRAAVLWQQTMAKGPRRYRDSRRC